MDADRDLLFGVVALQKGAVDADRLAETCALWVAEPTLPLADLMVNRGLMTVEKRTELQKVVDSRAGSARRRPARNAGRHPGHANARGHRQDCVSARSRCTRRAVAGRSETQSIHPD